MKAGLYLWVASAFIATLAVAQDREWAEAMTRAHQAEDRGDYLEAVSQARRAVAVSERLGPRDERTWVAYNFLGIAYQEAGLLAESLHTFRHTLGLIKSALGTENPVYAVELANEGTVYIVAGDPHIAVSKLEEALRIEMRCSDPVPVRLPETQSRLGEALLAVGRRDEAERMMQLAVSAFTKNNNTIEGAIALNNLGIVRRWQHRYDEAIELVTRSIAMIDRAYGPGHPLSLRPLNNLAVLNVFIGKYEEADAAFQQGKAICEKKLPRDHPSYAGLLANYAYFLRKTGEKSRAKAMEQQARTLNRDNSRRDGLSLTVDASAFRHP
ncbi:MAG TPA: tetratricopeptide repeat protein [Bryobacteraceae bacterium]|nr:tetratricopeptide repeat protein [Bryobacteraceae bacterium]